MSRPVENSDLWAAIRGMEMHRKTNAELSELVRSHRSNELFASKVIAEAAMQVLTTRCTSGAEKRRLQHQLGAQP